jgi:hypothetical protein
MSTFNFSDPEYVSYTNLSDASLSAALSEGELKLSSSSLGARMRCSLDSQDDLK